MNLKESVKRPTRHEEPFKRLRNPVAEDALKPGEKVPAPYPC